MRLTDQQLSSTLNYNISKNRSSYYQLVQEVSSGEKVITIADDPGTYRQIMGMEDTLSRVEGYKENISNARQELYLYEDSIDGVVELMNEMKQLVLKAGNTASYASAEENYVQNAEDILNSLITLANNNVSGKYMFSGSITDQKPFTTETTNGKITAVNYNGDNRSKVISLDTSDKIQLNLSGQEIFLGQAGADENIFQAIISVRDDMQSDGFKNVDEHIEQLDTIVQNLLGKRGEIGTYVNHVDSMEDFLNKFEIGLEEKYSELRYTDMAEAISDLLSTENVLTASLEVASRMNDISILNYL